MSKQKMHSYPFTVISVFAPPVGNAENKADKQSKYRYMYMILGGGRVLVRQ